MESRIGMDVAKKFFLKPTSECLNNGENIDITSSLFDYTNRLRPSIVQNYKPTDFFGNTYKPSIGFYCGK